MFLPMTVVITASTDKNHNSVITVKDQYGQRTIDLPTPGREPDHSADQPEKQLMNDHISSPGPMVLSANIEAPETTAISVEHEDKLPTPEQEENKPSTIAHDESKLSIPVQEEDETPALVPMRVDIDDSLLPPSTRLQRYLKETDELIVCPGVYDGFSARIAISVGYKAMYMVRYVYICPLERCADIHADRRWHHCFTAWAGRPGHRPAP